MENVFNNHQSPRLQTPQEVNMNELETPLTMESDTNVEKAEACAKELEDVRIDTLYQYNWQFSFILYNFNFKSTELHQSGTL